MKLQNNKEWKLYCTSGKKPSDIPSHPSAAYKGEGWTNLADWLGYSKDASTKRKEKT